MQIIGIDVSKAELVGARIDKSGKVRERYTFPNTRKDIESFLGSLPSKTTIGCEATAEYHNRLVEACLAEGMRCVVLNPIATKQYTRSTVRKRKTDMTDAEAIARCVLQGEGVSATGATLSVEKRMLRTAAGLAELKTRVSHMKKSFAEHWSEQVEVQDILTLLEGQVDTAMKAMRKEGIRSSDQEQVRLLASVPGIGTTLAATIASEVGDISRFRSLKSLIAYAGLDPKVRQSGTTLNRNGRLTKRGSPYLRRALFIAASVAQRHDPQLKAYCVKKRLEGKRYTAATVANARHVLARVHAVLRRGTPFVPERA